MFEFNLSRSLIPFRHVCMSCVVIVKKILYPLKLKIVKIHLIFDYIIGDISHIFLKVLDIEFDPIFLVRE